MHSNQALTMKEFFYSYVNVRWYWAIGLFCMAVIIVHRLFGAGFLVGVLAAAGNGFFLVRCYRFFFERKRLFIVVINYGVRYCVIGVVFYAAIKSNRVFFYGIITGFILLHAVFSLVQLFFLERSSRPARASR